MIHLLVCRSGTFLTSPFVCCSYVISQAERILSCRLVRPLDKKWSTFWCPIVEDALHIPQAAIVAVTAVTARQAVARRMAARAM